MSNVSYIGPLTDAVIDATINELKKKETKEILANIGKKIYLPVEIKDKKLIYRATVPANTSATLYLPAITGEGVTESGRKATNSDKVKYIKFEGGKAVFELQSGNYQFESAL